MLRPVRTKSRTSRVSQIALQPRNSAKSWYQSQTQLRKTKSRHLIRNNQIARERQFEAAAKRKPVHGRYGRERRFVESVHYRVDALDEISQAWKSLGCRQFLRKVKKLAQITTRAKAFGART